MFETLPDLLDHLEPLESRKHDVLLPATYYGMDSGGYIGSAGMDPLPPSWPEADAFRHLLSFFIGTKANPLAPGSNKAFDYLYNDSPGWLRATNVNHWLAELGNKKLLFRGYNDGGLDVIRAVASDRYGVVDNYHVAKMVYDVLGGYAQRNVPLRLGHTWTNRDTLYGRVYIPEDNFALEIEVNGVRRVHMAGFVFGNGEARNKSIIIAPFIQTSGCENSTIFLEKDRYGIQRSHHSLSLASARVIITSAIAECLKQGKEILERVFEAAHEELESPADVIEAIVGSRNLPPGSGTSLSLLLAANGGPNALGLSGAVTEFAQTLESQDVRVELEILGGQLLMAGPDNLFSVARRQAPVLHED